MKALRFDHWAIRDEHPREPGKATLRRFDQLDALSRSRALTEEESLELERAQERLIYGPFFAGMDRELAARGLLDTRRRRGCAHSDALQLASRLEKEWGRG